MSTKKVTEKSIPECVIQSLYGGAEYTGDKPWMQFDTWDVELACKLITLGYPVDLEGSGWDGAKKWPLDKWGRGSLTGVMRIFDRALGIAKSSIHAGKIKEHDTPANWIKWAQEKGYDVAHLIPAMAQEQIELSLADAVEINNAAKLLGCTVKALFEQAENDERLLYVALKPHSSKLAAIPSHPSPQQSSRKRSYTVIVPLLSRYAASLAVSGSADIAQYQASFGGVHDWHYWMLDMPQTVSVDMVFVPRSQLLGAPAAVKQAAPDVVDTTIKASEEPPGKMPRTETGKLTVEAAWEIERETAKKPTAEIVMERLQLWAKEIPNNHPALIKSIPHGVVWATKKDRKEKKYMIEDCGRHLTEWYKSLN